MTNTTTTRTSQTVALPDGSTALVEPIGSGASLISRRLPDGRIVWGQAFSTYADAHPAQVARVLADMGARPDDFHRWQLR